MDNFFVIRAHWYTARQSEINRLVEKANLHLVENALNLQFLNSLAHTLNESTLPFPLPHIFHRSEDFNSSELLSSM